MKYQVIFTDGYEYVDELESLEKQVRGDVLILNEQGNYYRPLFITLQRLSAEFGINSDCYIESRIVILHDVSKEAIFKSIPQLHKQEFFKYWSVMNKEYLEKYFYPKENWVTETIEIEVI